MKLGLRVLALVILVSFTTTTAHAQGKRRAFAGVLFGVSTLSADGRAVVAADGAATSLYKPENGLAADVFGGFHFGRYFSVQANYMWNRNDLTLVSTVTGPAGGAFYEQQRRSRQHVLVADALVYFRPLGSGIRPYLGTGLCLVRFSSDEIVRTVAGGLPEPQGAIMSTRIALRSHVGIDLALSARLSVRYSFSETISGNPISPHLMPRGERGLANFQNLVGLVTRF